MEMQRFKSLYGQPSKAVNLAETVLASPQACDTLTRQLARLQLKRLLGILINLCGDNDASSAELGRTHLNALVQADDDLVVRHVTSANICALIALARMASSERDVSGLCATKWQAHLGNSVLDLWVSARAASTGRYAVICDADGVLELPLSGYRIARAPDVAKSSPLAFACGLAGGVELLDAEGAPIGRIEWNAQGLHTEGILLENCCAVGDSTISVVCGDPTPTFVYADAILLLPKGFSNLADRRHCVNLYSQALEGGLGLLREFWPQGHTEVLATIQRILPLENNQGNHPFNFSIHALRGLVATTPRPRYFAAQLLAHESGHNRFSTILDLYDLVRPTSSLSYSPFVNAMRPPHALLHGIFSFIRDIEITRRMMPSIASEPDYPMDRYFSKILARIEQAIATAKRDLEFTGKGHELLDGFDQALGGLRAA